MFGDAGDDAAMGTQGGRIGEKAWRDLIDKFGLAGAVPKTKQPVEPW